MVQNTNVPLDASGFNAIPTALAGTAKFGKWVAAFSVLVPLSLQYNDHASLTVPGQLTNVVYSSSVTEVWYGLSAARKFGEHFAIGFSVFGIQHDETAVTGVDTVSTVDGTFATALARQNMSVLGILGTLGVSLIPMECVRFGARVQTAMAQIYGKGESYSVSRLVPASGAPTASGEDVSGAANYGIPFALSLGTAIRPAEWLTLMGDVSLQLATSYEEFPASMNTETVSLRTTPRFNLGVEAVPAPDYPLRVGFYYDPSTRSGHAGDPDF